MEKSGSGINIPDPQHCGILKHIFSFKCVYSPRLEQDLGRVGDRRTSAQDQPGELGEAEGGRERGSGQQRSDPALLLHGFPSVISLMADLLIFDKC
jgi:hypothetical protein